MHFARKHDKRSNSDRVLGKVSGYVLWRDRDGKNWIKNGNPESRIGTVVTHQTCVVVRGEDTTIRLLLFRSCANATIFSLWHYYYYYLFFLFFIIPPLLFLTPFCELPAVIKRHGNRKLNSHVSVLVYWCVKNHHHFFFRRKNVMARKTSPFFIFKRKSKYLVEFVLEV